MNEMDCCLTRAIGNISNNILDWKLISSSKNPLHSVVKKLLSEGEVVTTGRGL